MDGGTSGVREWMTGPGESTNVSGEQHRDMGGRPRERNIKWVPKAKACPGGRVPRLGSRDQERIPASAEGSWVSRSVSGRYSPARGSWPEVGVAMLDSLEDCVLDGCEGELPCCGTPKRRRERKSDLLSLSSGFLGR